MQSEKQQVFVLLISVVCDEIRDQSDQRGEFKPFTAVFFYDLESFLVETSADQSLKQHEPVYSCEVIDVDDCQILIDRLIFLVRTHEREKFFLGLIPEFLCKCRRIRYALPRGDIPLIRMLIHTVSRDNIEKKTRELDAEFHKTFRHGPRLHHDRLRTCHTRRMTLSHTVREEDVGTVSVALNIGRSAFNLVRFLICQLTVAYNDLPHIRVIGENASGKYCSGNCLPALLAPDILNEFLVDSRVITVHPSVLK